MACCQQCFDISPPSGSPGVYTLERRVGGNVWFSPAGTLIPNVPANAGLLAEIKAAATAANEVLCGEVGDMGVDTVTLSGSGRFYGSRNQWTGFGYTYGPTYYQFDQAYGAGALPAPAATSSLGHVVPRAGVLKRLTLVFRRSGAEAVPMDWRVTIVRGATVIDAGGVTDSVFTTSNRTVVLPLNLAVQEGDQILLSVRKVGGTGAILYAYTAWTFLLT